MPSASHPFVRRAVAALVAALVATTVLLPVAQANGGSEFVSLTNQKRASVGLGPVALSGTVERITDERAGQMAKADVLAHDLTYVEQRLTQLGVCWRGVGEIIAWEKGWPSHSYQRTIDAWWASPGHHAIMVGTYGVAAGSWAVSATGATYSVMVFVATCSGWSDATGLDPAPTVVGRSPVPGATGVSLRPAVRATFSEPVSGVGKSTFVLVRSATGATVSASVSYDASTKTATLVPGSKLALGAWYTAVLRSGIRDRTGHALAPTSWKFRARTVEVFSSARSVTISKGKHVGYRFDSTGRVVAARAYTLSRASGAPSSKRAVIVNRSGVWLYITKGVWAGYWMPASSGVVLG